MPRHQLFMGSATAYDLYSPREIAQAAGVAEADVRAALGRERALVPRADAVRVGRMLVQRTKEGRPDPRGSLFALYSDRLPSHRRTGLPLALSSTLHAGLIALAIFVATFNLTPRAASLHAVDRPSDPMRLVFLASPGTGGGGGGGGLLRPTLPPRAMRQGRSPISRPISERREPKPLRPVPAPPEPAPAPPLEAEPLPVVMAPIIAAPADARTRAGVLHETTAQTDSHGPGSGEGIGNGTGTGLGAGDGGGIGPGSGGGAGGGTYRPGSGIEPPRLLREVKADYTEDARRRGVSGDVVLEIVVRRDGSVGDVTVRRGLAGGLNERAVLAVRQWQFTPARRQGAPVDVAVEVAVEFRLR